MASTEMVHQPTTIDADRLHLARFRDNRVRELEKQHVATWSEMAELCTLVEQQGDWKILGFESYNRWLLDAAPVCRSSVYAAQGLVRELNEIPTEELRQIPPGNAKVLAAVPKSKRTKSLVQAAKESRPAAFTKHVQEKHPELHIETMVPRKFKFEASQATIIDAAMLMANILETGEVMEEIEMAPEALLEKICADYMERNRPLYEKIRERNL